MTDKEQIESIIRDSCNKDYNKGMVHMHDDCIFIRPSGNPLSKTGWKEMMTSSDVDVKSNNLLKIIKLSINNNMAYACYISHSEFQYKNNMNNDVAVFTSIFEKVNGKWMTVHGHRSTGRSPTEAMSLLAE